MKEKQIAKTGKKGQTFKCCRQLFYMLMAIELPTHLVDLTIGAIADHLDKLKDASGILQETKGK